MRDLRDHLDDQPQAAAFAFDLFPQAGDNSCPSAVDRPSNRFRLSRRKGREVADALRHQQPLASIQMLAARIDQSRPFAAAAAFDFENSLHWVMGMVFRDGECRVRTENAPANFTPIKHLAHNLTRRAPGKDSIRLRRKTAARGDDDLASLAASQFFHPIPLGDAAWNFVASPEELAAARRRETLVSRTAAG